MIITLDIAYWHISHIILLTLYSALVFFMQVGFAMLCAGEYHISFVQYWHRLDMSSISHSFQLDLYIPFLMINFRIYQREECEECPSMEST